MALPFPGLDVPVVDPQTGQMTQAWYSYFQSLPKDSGGFLHFGGTNFVYRSPNPTSYQSLSWTNVKFNQGNIIGSKPGLVVFLPPAGARLIHLDAQIWITSGFASGSWVAKWIKNATVNGSGVLTAGADVVAGVGSPSVPGTVVIRASGVDAPNSGDHYALFLYCDVATPGTTFVTVDGNPAHTYAMAYVVA